MRRSYIILAGAILILVGLYQFKLLVQSHHYDRAGDMAIQTIDEYVIMVDKCRKRYPNARAREIHECATNTQ